MESQNLKEREKEASTLSTGNRTQPKISRKTQ
jgi:hypothetical protein